MDICSDVDALRTLYVVKSFLNIGKLLVPLILMVMCSIDIYKVVIKTSYKPYSVIFKRFVAALLVFFIGTIIDVVLNTLGEANVSATSCWANANRETIAVLQEIKIADIKAKAEAEQKRREEARAKRNEELKNIKIHEDKIINSGNSGNNGGSSSGEIDYSLFSENGSDGQVDVINGVFYKPSTMTSGTDGTKGSAPYGYNKFFYSRLTKFIEAAAQNGYTITMSGNDYGSWRPYSLQQYYYNCYLTKACNNGNLAALPGSSNHGWGIASDLAFSSQSAKYWAHDNCKAYGLSFNLCQNIRGSCAEDWHIEPTVIAKK